MYTIMIASTIVSGTSLIALGTLVGVFAKMYSRTKARLPLGMMLFSGLLFLHNVIGVYAYFSMTELYGIALLPYFLAVHIAELVGILVFLKITLQ